MGAGPVGIEGSGRTIVACQFEEVCESDLSVEGEVTVGPPSAAVCVVVSGESEEVDEVDLAVEVGVAGRGVGH